MKKRIKTAIHTVVRGKRRPGHCVITKSISIDAPYDQVFPFLINPMNWPRWAVINVLSVAPSDDDGWQVETPFGSIKVYARVRLASGVIDHDIQPAGTAWRIRGRVVPDGEGCVLTITFLKPPSFTHMLFENHLSDFDHELDRLKRMMEQWSSIQPPAN